MATLIHKSPAPADVSASLFPHGNINPVSRNVSSRKARYKQINKNPHATGATVNPAPRLDKINVAIDEELISDNITVLTETAKNLVTKNDSPDIGFNRSINPYRGCAHGCTYCYARPTHAYMNLSAGIDFETKLFAKTSAATALRHYFSIPRYKPEVITIGTSTDAYQPIEKKMEITRDLLKVFLEFKHPVSITTKSALILRDLDILKELAKDNLVHVTMSVTTLDRHLSRIMEPKASTPQKRLDAIRVLSDAGIPTAISLSPVIPAINDHEMEAILAAGVEYGAKQAYYIILRLPHDVKQVFSEWLAMHFPDRARHVLSVLKSMHGEKLYDAQFGTRMRGTGPYAKMLMNRFDNAVRRLNIKKRQTQLSIDHFMRPSASLTQLDLFEALPVKSVLSNTLDPIAA